MHLTGSNASSKAIFPINSIQPIWALVQHRGMTYGTTASNRTLHFNFIDSTWYIGLNGQKKKTVDRHTALTYYHNIKVLWLTCCQKCTYFIWLSSQEHNESNSLEEALFQNSTRTVLAHYEDSHIIIKHHIALGDRESHLIYSFSLSELSLCQISKKLEGEWHLCIHSFFCPPAEFKGELKFVFSSNLCKGI